jgi:hypothetical protein
VECLTAALPQPGTCTICGIQKNQEETWFLITENGWEDRLIVWKWDRQMAAEARVHSLCSPKHVRELVVHWMTTGCLHYPFASAPDRSSHSTLRFTTPARLTDLGEPVTQHLGEIAMDHQGILRVLGENPLSLNTILDELTIVLENQLLEDAEAEVEDEPQLVLPTI